MDYLSENLLTSVSEWKSWSPRENITPIRTSFNGYEQMSSKRFGDCGKIFTTVEVESEAFYELCFKFRIENIEYPRMSTRFIFDSYTEDGTAVQTDYAVDYTEKDGFYYARGVFQALKGSARAEISAMMMSTEAGKLSVYDASLRKVTPLGPRNVKIGTVYLNPYITEDNTYAIRQKKILDCCDKAGEMGVDILLFAEVISTFSISKQDPDYTVQTIPGEYTALISEKAKKNNMWILFNTSINNPGDINTNTTLIFNRKGEIAGRYDKTHITYNAYNNGGSAGNEYPVFDTDFGRIGTVTCYDQFFPETVRAVTIQGAEIVFVPTAGDGYTQLQARAIDNQVYVVVAGINHAKASNQPISRIINPLGEIIAGTNEDMGIATATVDLNKKNYTFWFSVGARYGDKREIFQVERRPEAYGVLCE